MKLNRRATLTLGVSAFGAAAVALIPGRSMAASPEVYTEDGVAIDGTDPVSYFKSGKPIAGKSNFAIDYKGSKFLFSSAANKAAFEADPEAYAPKYGGYCAFAMARGYVAPTEPDAWTIVDGKLYLNFNLSVRDRWSKDIPGNIAAADGHWPKPLQN